MKLCVPVADAPQGGMYSFFRNFRKYLDSAAVSVTDDVEADYDVLVANSWVVPEAVVARAKRRRPRLKVLHRIDGSAADYGRDAGADVRQALVDLLADATVFQSAYGREVTRRRGIIAGDGPVIHNAVDVERFRADGPRLPLPGTIRLAHVAYSTNARKGAAAVFGLARRRADVTFVMVGRYEAPAALPPNVVMLGLTDWERLPVILRSCTALLTLSENEACPNVVLEGLASGLPVLYKASGGTPELVGECGAAVDAETFDAALATVLARHAPLAAAARARAEERFAFAAVFPRYLDTITRAPRRPLPGPADYVRALGRLRASPATVARWLASRARRASASSARA
jgi:glycosyltransferase involved in cell wall biosynthesis